MTKRTLSDAYNIVSNHLGQTSLVNKLLENWTIDKSLIQYKKIDNESWEEGDWYFKEDSDAELPDIYEWLIFPTFWDSEYEKLVNAWIPILRIDEEDWVGITSYGSHYDLQIYPELIRALFDIETDYQGIRAMKKGR